MQVQPVTRVLAVVPEPGFDCGVRRRGEREEKQQGEAHLHGSSMAVVGWERNA